MMAPTLPPTDVPDDSIARDLTRLTATGVIRGWRSERVGTRRRWVVRVSGVGPVSLAPAQVWAFILGADVGSGVLR